MSEHFDFEVIPSDDPTVRDADKGFLVEVSWTVTAPEGGKSHGVRRVLVPSTADAVVQLGFLSTPTAMPTVSATVIDGGNASAAGYVIRPRRDTTLGWAATNPVLALGEIGFDTDTGEVRVGNGVNQWSDLPDGMVNAYSIAVANGFVGDEAAWLASLVGPVGPVSTTPGPPGPPGPPNVLAVGTVTTGAAGSSAAASITGTAPSQTLNLTIPRGNTGDPTAYELRGTGSPEGVVTAPVGTYYTDTVGTTGAWRWLKKTGTGNTGWQVVDGDTGLRNIVALVTGTYHSGGTMCRLARVGSSVFLTMDVVTVAGYTATTALTLPAGFRSIPTYLSPGYSGSAWYGAGGSSIVLNTSGANPGLRGTWSWITSDQWPTTLPGTAA